MPTQRQLAGQIGENIVVNSLRCPECNRTERTFRRLPNNFKCADIICDFCGFLAQVKTKKVKQIEKLPKEILGAAWKPQMERMEYGIYFSLYIVLINSNKKYSVYFLHASQQDENIFEPRPPLGINARRSGWQGFKIRLDIMSEQPMKIASGQI